ncbi:hypothetical protein JRO89_XS03G0169000 [Xanthoceras sorbifolium]|uniref:AB hydrolase-1 domain-containing protein n=1 Tax=Xanthoceras sorbifolium TaxID=99658 RepID=A0ABQ8IA76_9ROSI|nr:hypothetical protein JRO89_XS03G0169000 [Xanthoceras sorbifolium]
MAFCHLSFTICATLFVSLLAFYVNNHIKQVKQPTTDKYKLYNKNPISVSDNSLESQKMEEIRHRTVHVNGIDMHVAEKGEEGGPVVLFLHGFPELWYSWRHQIAALAALGYRAVAPDLRGFGDTEAPDSAAAYTPDRVKALVNMSVMFNPRNPKWKPLETLKAIYGHEYYTCRFQEPGEIEAEFARIGTETVLKEFFTYRTPGPLFLPKGKGFGHSPDAKITLPSWLSEEDVSYYTTKYEKTGFTPGINYYRNIDLNWELTAAWTGSQIKVPVKFIVGDQDLTYNSAGAKDYINKGGFKRDVPFLQEVVVMEGVAHFLNQEKPDEINQHIYDFFQKF